MVGNKWTVVCRCCGCVFNSKLGVILAHEQSSKHAEAALVFEREAKRKAAARALFGAEIVAAAAAARIATDRQEKDPNTRGQIATLLHLVRSSDVKSISVERLLFASS